MDGDLAEAVDAVRRCLAEAAAAGTLENLKVLMIDHAMERGQWHRLADGLDFALALPSSELGARAAFLKSVGVRRLSLAGSGRVRLSGATARCGS